MLSRGRFKVTLERSGAFYIIITNLTLRGGKVAYLESLSKKPANSLLVSLADKTHNARAIVDDLIEHGEEVWDRFTGGKQGLLWYCRAPADAFDTLLPGAGARRLSATVRVMEELGKMICAVTAHLKYKRLNP